MFIKEEQKRGVQFTNTSLDIQFEGPFGESQSERQPYLAGSQNRMAHGSTGVQPNSGVAGEFATFRSSGTPPCNFGFSTKYRGVSPEYTLRKNHAIAVRGRTEEGRLLSGKKI